MPGVDISFDNPDFLFDLAKRYTMTLHTDAGEVMSIDLEGSFAALTAAIECNES